MSGLGFGTKVEFWNCGQWGYVSGPRSDMVYGHGVRLTFEIGVRIWVKFRDGG